MENLKKIFFLSIFFYSLTVFQTSFLSQILIKGLLDILTPLILLLIVFLAKSEFFDKTSGFLGGFFLDIFSPSSLGVETFSVGLTILLARRFLQEFKKNNFLFFLMFISFGILFYQTLKIFFNFFFNFF